MKHRTGSKKNQIRRHSKIHVGILDGDGGLLREGVLEDEVLLLGLADGRSPATHPSAGGGPVGGGGGGVGGDAQLPLPQLLHVLDLLQGDAARRGKGGRASGIRPGKARERSGGAEGKVPAGVLVVGVVVGVRLDGLLAEVFARHGRAVLGWRGVWGGEKGEQGDRRSSGRR